VGAAHLREALEGRAARQRRRFAVAHRGEQPARWTCHGGWHGTRGGNTRWQSATTGTGSHRDAGLVTRDDIRATRSLVVHTTGEGGFPCDT
jgi:hypothetical protein